MAGGWQALNTPSERGAAAFGFKRVFCAQDGLAEAAGFDSLILTPIKTHRSIPQQPKHLYSP